MKLVGLDIETMQDEKSWGLQPWRAKTDGASITTICLWASETEKLAVKRPTTEQLRKILTTAAEKDWNLVVWNGLFELSWFHALGLGDEVSKCKWVDAMLLLKRLDGWLDRDLGGAGYGLKQAVARQWVDRADYGIGDAVTEVPQTDAQWAAVLEYNMLDARYTKELAEIYMSKLSPEELRAARHEALCLSPVALSYINGIHINEAALKALSETVAATESEVRKASGIAADVIASPKKLGDLLYTQWGYEPLARTPTGNPATDKEALMLLELAHPEDVRFKELMTLRKCATQKSKFVAATKKSMAYHGEAITRPSPFLSGTYTGRMTYSSSQGKGVNKIQTGIALHQWERGKPARAILEAPEGFLLAEFDASGQEMRLMADISGDETMLRLFNTGIDGHAYMGASIEGVDWKWVHEAQDSDPRAKAVRNLGKFCNLSFQYRVGVDTIRSRALTQYGLNLPYAKAAHMKATYLNTYRSIPLYWKRAIAIAHRQGYAETKGSRHIQLTNLSDYTQQQTAINYPIQGTGGDMKTLAIAVLTKMFNKDIIYAWDLHDALFLYIRDDEHAVARVKNIRSILSNLPYQHAWGWTPSLELPWDAKIGRNWGALKSVD